MIRTLSGFVVGVAVCGGALAAVNTTAGREPFVPFTTWRPPISVSTTPAPHKAGGADPAIPAAPKITLLPSPTATSTPAATSTPVVCAPGYATNPCPPTSTPAPRVAATFSAADCSWAEGVLAEDAALDSQEATALADGTDTRYPASDSSYYLAESQDWTQIDAWMNALCQGGSISVADAQTALNWISAARETHVQDEALNPQNSAWDGEWIGNYDRLTAMLESAGG